MKQEFLIMNRKYILSLVFASFCLLSDAAEQPAVRELRLMLDSPDSKNIPARAAAILADPGFSDRLAVNLILERHYKKEKDYAGLVKVFEARLPLLSGQKQKEQVLTQIAFTLDYHLKDRRKANLLREKIFRDESFSADMRTDMFRQWAAYAADLRKKDKEFRKSLIGEGTVMLELPGLASQKFADLVLLLVRLNSSEAGTGAASASLLRRALAKEDLPVRTLVTLSLKLSDLLLNGEQIEEAESVLVRALGTSGIPENMDIDLTAQLAKIRSLSYRLDGALDAIADMVKRNPSSPDVKAAAARIAADEYKRNWRWKEAADVLEKAGLKASAALLLPDAEKNAALRAALNDESLPVKERFLAYDNLNDASEESHAAREKFRAFYTANLPGGRINDRNIKNAMHHGNYALAEDLLRAARSVPAGASNPLFAFYHVRALYGLKRPDEAAALAKECAAMPRLEPMRKLLFSLLAELGKPAPDFEKVLSDSASGGKLSEQERSEALLLAGCTALTAERTAEAKALYAAREKLYAPNPAKVYDIPFFDRPISGISGFLAEIDRLPAQIMDRKFGGEMSFLVTDVGTGDRGVTGAPSAGSHAFNTFRAAADEYGLHLFFETPHAQPASVANGMIPYGSFEIYLAPGENQPHHCFIARFGKQLPDVWTTGYDTPFHHRLRNLRGEDVRGGLQAGRDRVYRHIFVSWKKYYNLLPEDGTLWDFEAIHWSPSGGYTWNGTKSIHGRSSWGFLRFHLTPAQRSRIRYHILMQARISYESEKKERCAGDPDNIRPGAIVRWQDPVLGDPAFYETAVKPLADRLDRFLPEVKEDMTPETVDRVYDAVAAEWFDIPYTIQNLRAGWLRDRLAAE